MTLDEYNKKEQDISNQISKNEVACRKEIESKFLDQHIYKDLNDREWIFFKRRGIFDRCLKKAVMQGEVEIKPYDMTNPGVIMVNNFFYPLDKYKPTTLLNSKHVEFMDYFNNNWLFCMREI